MRKALCTIIILLFSLAGFAQCSICTKTASQLGKEAGEGLNGGIVYLMIAPFVLAGFIGYRWWKNEKSLQGDKE